MAPFMPSEIEPMAISTNERAFFERLGTRIAELRKAQGITQVQFAKSLQLSQQTINAYEVGRRRMPVSLLPAIAKLLGVSLEELISEEPKPAKRGPTPKLQRHLERIQALPKTKQRFILEMIEAVLAQDSR